MKKQKANDKYPGFQDELVLAELIQNAAARGLSSTKGAMFRDAFGCLISVKQDEDQAVKAKGAVRKNPPKGAKCACALGAMALTPKLTKPLSILAMGANDTPDGYPLRSEEDLNSDGYKLEITAYGDERSMQIGLAYEQALRP